MMKRPTHTLLALIFALLQCAAPLVHAHVDGQHSGLLPPSLETQSLSEQFAQVDCSIEADESPAITIPHEFQRDDQPALVNHAASKTFDLLPACQTILVSSTAPPVSVFSPYSKSHPQAPPALG
jgi:hypothetical protein